MTFTILSQLIEQNAGGLVRDVHFGDVYDHWNNAEIQYPAMCYDLVSLTPEDGFDVYVVRFWYGDRLVEDESNICDAWDTCLCAARQFLQSFGHFGTLSPVKDSSSLIGQSVVEPGTMYPFNQRFADNLAGYYFDLTIRVRSEFTIC